MFLHIPHSLEAFLSHNWDYRHCNLFILIISTLINDKCPVFLPWFFKLCFFHILFNDSCENQLNLCWIQDHVCLSAPERYYPRNCLIKCPRKLNFIGLTDTTASKSNKPTKCKTPDSCSVNIYPKKGPMHGQMSQWILLCQRFKEN